MISKIMLPLVALALCAGAAAQVQPRIAVAEPTMQFQSTGNLSCRMAIRGQKQGQFKGQSPDKWMPCSQFLLSLTAPRDAATGMATGRKQYTLVVTKEWNAASMQILQAAATDENLPLVEFQFSRSAPQGMSATYQSVTLSNATISACKQYIGFPDAGEQSTTRPQENVTFSFQKIEVTHTEGGFSFADDVVRR